MPPCRSNAPLRDLLVSSPNPRQPTCEIPGARPPVVGSIPVWPNGFPRYRGDMSEPITFTMATLRQAAGTDLGVSRWLTVAQERIDAFAAATEDRQWIHVDPERAAAGPFGTTVAHGYLTLSLLPPLMADLIAITDASARLNYGLNKVRFPAPVPADSRIRARAVIVGVDEVAGGLQVVVRASIEREGGEKPVCVAEYLVRALD
ncbi:dehydratase [Nocardia arthritidis]|uniref:Dehydratase n=2 Tax=Nocardia arthritidis TaxID=228602 RepID=A0A6G9YBK5_9NOCA|nr:dehydratase [Nocardia arthritidis]